jgi:hypothetical protein
MNADSMALLSDEELDAVVGGMMNNGQGQFLQSPKNTGGPGMGTGQLAGELIMAGVLVGFALGL